MSESWADYSWYGYSYDLKEASLGFMDVNYIAESSLSGVTFQLQVFGLIGIASASAICNIARYVFLYLPTTNKEMSDKKISLFYYFPEELQITAIICAGQEDTATRQSNTDAMDRQSNTKQNRDNVVKWE